MEMLLNFLKIGKSELRRMLGDEIRKTYIYEPDPSFCEKYCLEYQEGEKCAQCVYLRKKYLNEVDRYKLYGFSANDRFLYLPKNTIKLFLVLHGLPIQPLKESGAIFNVRICHIAKLLGCHAKTVRASMKLLREKQFIDFYAGRRRGQYTIVLPQYQHYFLPANKGGAGYIELSKEDLISLVKITDVNSLRLELARLLHADEKQKSLDFNELAYALPKYNRYQSAYEIKSVGSKFFNLSYNSEIITIKSKKDIAAEKAKKKQAYQDKIAMTLKKFIPKEIDSKKIMNDIYSLILRYNFGTLKEAIKEIGYQYFVDGKVLIRADGNWKEKFPGLLQSVCLNKYALSWNI